MNSKADFHRELLDKLSETHNEDELRELSSWLDVKYEDLGGRGNRANAFELIARLEREGRVHELIAELRKTRPNTQWPDPPVKGEKAARGGAGEHLPIFSVPLRRNRNFSGREAQLLEIEQRLADGETTLAVAGLGGLGKTQLALEFCYRNRDAYELIYWLRADEAAALGASLAALAQVLGFAAEDMRDQEALRKQLFSWLESTEARWLLVYDNADRMKPRELNDYLPQSASDHTLITSRNPKFGGIAGCWNWAFSSRMKRWLLCKNEAVEMTGKERRGWRKPWGICR